MTPSPHPVLTAFDGRDRTPVRLGEVLAGLLGTSQHVAAGYHYEIGALSPRTTVSDENRARYEATVDAVRRTLRTSGNDAATSVLPFDRPAAGLAEVAAELDAGLVVLGGDRHGHVVADVIQRVRCPVVVAPEDELLIPAAPDSVGVAFDGSIGSRMALAVGAAIARRIARPLTVIGCSADGAAIDLEEHTDVLGDVERLVVSRSGDPITELRTMCEELDLLVCGSRGRGRLTSRLLGSVSAALVEHAPAPVVVVPAHARLRATTPLGVTTAAPE